MHKYLDYLKGDRVIWIISLIMLGVSLVTVFSFVPVLVRVEGGTPYRYLGKHAFYVLLSIITMYLVHKVNPKNFGKISKIAIILGVAMLLLTILSPTEVNSAKRWVKIPFISLTFQASDLAKLTLIIYLSKQLEKRKDTFKDWKSGFLPIMGPILLIVMLIVKDNFSTALIVFALAITMLFVGKFPMSRIFLVFAVALGLGFGAYSINKAFPEYNLLPRMTTWENRILHKIDDDANIIENAQVTNAKLAIYNGGLFGQGVGDGKLKEYLPEAYADFYYSSFVEEFGSLLAVLLMLVYLILLYRMIRIGLRSTSLFETYFCIGIGVLLITQASVNMLVCTGVFPVTGQNMPLLAMGGSALIMTCTAIGMVQAIAANNNKSLKE